MITLELIIAVALKDRAVLADLGGALASDLVVANPLYRQIGAFANDFLLKYGKLPQVVDWDLWLVTLPERLQNGVKLSLGMLLYKQSSNLDPDYFRETVFEVLQQAATKNAVSRLNLLGKATPEHFRLMTDEIEAIRNLSTTMGHSTGLIREQCPVW